MGRQVNSWTEEEDAILRKYNGIKTSVELVEYFKNRSYKAIRDRKSKLGLTTDHVFTDHEVDFIKDNSGKLSDKEISSILNLPYRVVRSKRRNLGILYRVNNGPYSRGECDKILSMYRSHSDLDISNMLGRPLRSIVNKRKELGAFRRPRSL